MKIEFANDQPVINAADLGPFLRLDPALVQGKMRAGEITSRYEIGQDEDSGTVRLTFFYRTTRLRLTCASDGTVLKQTRTTVKDR